MGQDMASGRFRVCEEHHIQEYCDSFNSEAYAVMTIDQFYGNGYQNCGNSSSTIEFNNVSFTNINRTSSQEVAVSLACCQTVVCRENLAQMNSYCLKAYGRKRAKLLQMFVFFLPNFVTVI